MKEDASGRRQRAVMATDAEWDRIGRAAAESGMDLSRFVIHRALDWDPLPAEVLRRAVREMLVLARLEERRLRGAGRASRDGGGGGAARQAAAEPALQACGAGDDCCSARSFDPPESNDINGFACRSALNPRAEQHARLHGWQPVRNC